MFINWRLKKITAKISLEDTIQNIAQLKEITLEQLKRELYESYVFIDNYRWQINMNSTRGLSTL